MVNFSEAVKSLRKAIVDFSLGSSEEEAAQKIVEDDVPLEKATAVSSRVSYPPEELGGLDLHQPIIDLDIPHYYGESSTPGHAHLILGVELPWSAYVELLTVLERCGIVEKGYVNVALRRGESWIRVPWVKKNPQDGTRYNPKSGWFETTIVAGDGTPL